MPVAASSVGESSERESPHDVTAVAEFDLVGEARNLPWAKVQK